MKPWGPRFVICAPNDENNEQIHWITAMTVCSDGDSW